MLICRFITESVYVYVHVVFLDQATANGFLQTVRDEFVLILGHLL